MVCGLRDAADAIWALGEDRVTKAPGSAEGSGETDRGRRRSAPTRMRCGAGEPGRHLGPPSALAQYKQVGCKSCSALHQSPNPSVGYSTVLKALPAQCDAPRCSRPDAVSRCQVRLFVLPVGVAGVLLPYSITVYGMV